jgi:CRISPR-associated protein Cmr4
MANLETKKIIAMATDPIYVGTGGYTIGRVDNTIVRDPITKIPKIPGSSIAGTWRYYLALELQSAFKDEYKKDLSKRAEKKDNIEELFNNPKNWMKNFEGNRFARIKCAGQDDESQKTLEDSQNTDTGHCGHCIVCKAFGFSKKDKSNQGMLFFSDLNILFFPVYTRLGVRWITSKRILNDAGMLKEDFEKKEIVFVSKNESDTSNYINLGWLNLPYEKQEIKIDLSNISNISINDIVIVPDNLISQIINSNLEVRTSVSIDPITGAAKEGALFTSEAIPRGTVFCGEIRGFKREGDESLPSLECVFEALDDTKKYFNSLGIGGMTTRGFGRMKILNNQQNEGN